MAKVPEYIEIDRMGKAASSRGGRKPVFFLLHTQEGNGTAESLAGYLNNTANGVSYHYTVRDRIVVDVVDTDLASWSVGDANPITINLCFAGSFAGWSRADWLRIDADLRIAAWLAVQDARKYGFVPAWLGSGGHYRAGSQGVSDHQYVTDVIGWGTHTDVGPGFPGDVFERYLRQYSGIAAASGSLEGEDDMPSLDEIGRAVWDTPIPMPDGTTERAGILLGWLDKHGADTVAQLAGPESEDQREELEPTGWPQLGKHPDGSPRSLVDGLAAALTKLDQIIATQVDQAERLKALEDKS